MKKILFLMVMVLTVGFLTTSCADSKSFTDNKGKQFTAEPYGWANTDARKMDTVMYSVCGQNIFWDVVFSESVIVPIWLTGWQLFEPERLKTADEYNRTVVRR